MPRLIQLLAIAVMVVVAVGRWPTTSFPGLGAVPPVALAALVIAVGSQVPAGPLGVTPLTWIGDRSYGWYLWHWPLIVMARQAFSVGMWGSLVAAAVALIPTVLSYRFIERPVIENWTPPRLSARRTAMAGGMAAAVLLSMATVFSFGARRTWGLNVSDRVGSLGVIYGTACFSADTVDSPRCDFAPSTDPPRGTIVLMGDSHAAAVGDGAIAAANELGYRVLAITAGSCPFVDVQPEASKEECIRKRSEAWDLIGSDPPAAVVIAHNSMDYVFASRGYSQIENEHGDMVFDHAEAMRLWSAGLNSTQARLDAAGVPLFMIDTVPTIPIDALTPTMLTVRRGDTELTRAEWEASRSEIYEAEHAVLHEGQSVDPADILCASGLCSREMDGQALYHDHTHLSDAGALLLAPSIKGMLAGLASDLSAKSGCCTRSTIQIGAAHRPHT